MLRLHVGCGARLEREWTNIDMEINHHPDQRDVVATEIDVRKMLPYGAGSVDMIYSEHFIEHLTRDEGQAFFAECFRVMRVGAAIRISTPDLATVVEAYQNGDLGRWRRVGYLPTSPARMVNEALTLWGHRFTYDLTEIVDALEAAGFHNVARRPHGKSNTEGMLTEGRPFCGDLIVEAHK